MTDETRRVAKVARKRPAARKKQRTQSKTRKRKSARTRAGAPSAARRAILVLGMHRSGTSAITKLLGICGARLPKNPLAASEMNRKGFFESDPIYRLHVELLEEIGTSWDDLAPLNDSWLASPIAAHYIERMASIVEDEFGDAPLIVVKDPRLCRLVPFWREVLGSLEIEPCFVLPIRNPLEVAASLEQAQGIPPLKGLLLWLQYFLQAERDSRSGPRAFLTYDRLLDDWRAVVRKLGRDLDLSFPRLSRRAAAEGDEFLTRTLRNQTRAPDDYADREDVVDWVKEVYAWAQRAAKSRPASVRRLDQIWAAYCVAEVAFGPVVAHSQLDRDNRKQEAQQLLAEVTELKQEIGELQGQLVPRERLDQLYDEAHTKEKQVADLVECIKLMLAWIANSTPAGQQAHERLESLMKSLDSAEGASVSEIASHGLQGFQHSEMLRLQQENHSRASREQELSIDLQHSEQRIEALDADARALREQLDARGADVASLQAQVASYTQQLEARNEVVGSLEQQLQTHRDHGATQQQQLEAQHDVIRTQEEQLRAQREQLASHQQQLDAQHVAIRSLEDQLRTERDRVASEHQQLLEAQQQAATRNAALEALENARAEQAEQLARLESESEGLRARVAESDAQRRQADDRYEQLEREVGQARAEIDRLDGLRLENDASRAVVEADNAELQRKLGELTAEVKRLRDENSVALGEIQRLHGVATRAQRQRTAGEPAATDESLSAPAGHSGAETGG